MKSLTEFGMAEFLTALAAKTPTPGGGAVACVAGALGAAQAMIVIAYSIGKKDLAEHQGALAAAQGRLERCRALLLQLGDEDAECYRHLNELQKMKDAGADPGHRGNLAEASLACAVVPGAAMAACIDALEQCEKVANISNKHLRSDLWIAAIMLEAAARAGRCNVEVNLPGLGDDVTRDKMQAGAALLGGKATSLLKTIVPMS